MNEEKILVIDDEEDMLDNCKRILDRKGFSCITTNNPLEAQKIVSEARPAVVVTDLKMPEKDGMELMKELKEVDPSLIVIVFTAYASVSAAVEAMKDGAFDFIPKPFSSDQLVVTIERALKHKRLEMENKNLRTQLDDSYGFDKIIGKSSAITAVFELIKKVAKTEANILIYGESGTGKELISKSVHVNSNRRDRAFIPVDCVALSENLLESELFGHEKGSFTGAHASKSGLFELSDKGTIYFDEIAKMNLATQAKLLRVLQEKQFRRVGGSNLLDVDFRVISTTNIDLNKAISSGEFIEDLFWRLNVITIEIPPLRERREDIELLTHHFIDEYAEKNNKSIKGITAEASEALYNYNWPGNIRELQNVIERATSLTDDRYINISDLPGNVIDSSSDTDYMNNLPFKSAKRKWLESFERKYFTDILQEFNGNISKAARKAGIDRKTVYRILKKHGIDSA